MSVHEQADVASIPESEDIYAIPASFSQQRLWFLDRLQPGDSAYNLSAALRLEGTLNRSALEKSLHEIVLRHETLRTAFQEVEGELMQIIYPNVAFALAVVDLQELSEETQEQRVAERTLEESRTPFDLQQGNLIRALLLRLGAEQHVLVLTMHHIVSDGWSLGVLVQEFVTLYQTFASGGTSSPLEELPIQYADYALWLEERVAEGLIDKQLAYWKAQLAGELSVLQLPTDHPRPIMQRHVGKTYRFSIPAELTANLSKLSQREGVTLFMTLLTGFKTLLYRYSGQNDLFVGTPVANRNRSEIENLIGFFVNTLVLRTDASNNPAFLDLLSRVKQTTLNAYNNQEVPLEKLVEELQPSRDMSYSPLFQVMFALQNAPMPELNLPGLTVKPMDLDNGTAKFDLTLFIEEIAGSLTASVEYNTDLFELETIEKLSTHFVNLLQAITQAPQTPIDELTMLSDADLHELLVAWNDTKRDIPVRTLPQLLEAQAAKFPDAVAIIDGERRLTFAQLNDRANQIGHYLQKRGIIPDTLVGLCMNRSTDLLVSLLGILKAGGAYLPLDPHYPIDRTLFTLQDANVALLLTQEHLLPHLQAFTGETICLEQALAEIEQESTKNTNTTLEAHHLAYVIYTSGSTGVPKGVAVEHQSASALVHWAKEVYRPEEYAGMLFSTSVCFDISIFEIFVPLSWGGKLIISENALHVATLPAKDEITLINTVPSAIAELLRMDTIPASVKVINLAGEALKKTLVHSLYEIKTLEKLYNLYGPTEDTVYSTFALMDRALVGPPPIGRPLMNTKAYVLNNAMQPVPIGVAGELYLGGTNLARGYLGRPEYTAERFIPNPFAPNERLYRTGDLVRYLPDGTIDYLGRIDHQVKVRGFRIELGEIEYVLSQQPDVEETTVIVREDQPGNQQIVAYVVQTGEHAPTTNALRQAVKNRLPEYMVPSAFVMMDELPLTPSGKVDRKALPQPEQTRENAEVEYVAPRSPIEEELAAIWSELLGVEQIGIYDNFFTLGGHSLLATRLSTKIRTVFQAELPMRMLFAEASTVAGMAEQLKHALDLGTHAFETITKVSRDQELSTSYAQRRLWLLDQLEPGTAAYNIPFGVMVRGDLDIDVLKRCFQEIAERHEALRTRFVTYMGQPIQVISGTIDCPLPVIDLTDLNEAERNERALLLAKEEAAKPFDLQQGPLLRTTLIRFGAREHKLLVTMHHIVSDGWSIGVIIREITALYPALCNGQQLPLKVLDVQYADYAAWQNEKLSGPAMEMLTDYWTKQLGGELPVLELPTDYPRPARRSLRGGRQVLRIRVDVTQRLHELSREKGVTLFMSLLATYSVLFYRLSLQEDLIIGSPIAGRNHPETEELIGCFVNTLALRVDLTGNPTFADLLERVRTVCLDAYAHQDMPFEKLVEELQPERNMSYSPLFQVMLVLQNAPVTALELPGLSMEVIEGENETSKFDLTLVFMEEAGELVGTLEYNVDLFDRTTAERMTTYFGNLLEGVVENADLPISRLPLISDAERHQLLTEWNDTATELAGNGCLHHLFEEQAAKMPDAVALVTASGQMTYEELNGRANQLAAHLRECGVEQGELVGISMERSPEMIVGLLGILKAGAAYVPLDPAYPAERLAFLLEDTAATVIVTQERLLPNLPASLAMKVCIDRDWDAISTLSVENASGAATADSLAYVMYTSGSTGRPKGVCTPHRGVVRLVKENPAIEFSAEHVFLQFAPIGFDASTLEIWGSLLHGAKLVIFPAHQASLAELGQTIREHGVTTLWLTAGLFHQMVDEHLADLKGVRQLLAGGDVLSVPHVVKVLEQLEEVRLINGYGPTENTTFTTCYSMTETHHVGASVPIGRPIGNTEVYVLDRYLQPVPVGVVGELHIGGAGLAHGYLNLPELTAERFIAHPFSDDPNARLYKSGDLVRYLQDGNLEYIGRIDNQVKIRGFRVDPGEIEAALLHHPSVAETVVLAREDGSGSKRLIAYVVTSQEEASAVGELRAFLRNRLPEQLIPSLFVTLDQLPLTTNGKVDRKALPVPDVIRPELSSEYVAPRNELESAIAAIWSEVLLVEQVGIHDSFFELGGHSLLATQAVSRMRSVLHATLPLRALFENKTIAALAAEVASLRQGSLEGGSLTEPIPTVTREGGVPLSFTQQRLWFLDQLEPGNSAYNIYSGVRMSGYLETEVLVGCLNELAERHETLRTTFQEENGLVQRIVPSIQIELPVVDLSQGAQGNLDAEVERLALEEFHRPFDLQRGPLLRTRLLRLAETEHVLLITMHHIISDGWSMSVLVRELGELYAASRQGVPAALPELTVQYADYAVWQNEKLSGTAMETLTDYWTKQLDGVLPVLELPTDYPRPAKQSLRGGRHVLRVPAEVTQKLQDLSSRKGVTLFMTFLAAFSIQLHRLSRQEDLIIGTPIAGRTRTETEHLIGCFLNTLALRVDLTGNPTFADLLERVRTVCLDAYAHQDMPFEKLVEILQPERSLSRNPIFDVLINFVNTPNAEASVQGLAMNALDIGEPQSKFALTLYVHERDDGMELEFVYQRDLYSPARMQEFARQYNTLLEQIAAKSDGAITSYSLLTPESRQLISDPLLHLDKPFGASVYEMFRNAAQRNPEVAAVVQRGQQRTYRELADAVRTLAEQLVASGLQRGEAVAIYGSRCAGLVAGMLGVLAAGGVILTIDRNMTFDRRRAVLAASGTKRLLYMGERLDDDHLLFTDTEWTDIQFIEEMTGRLQTNPNDFGVTERPALPEIHPDDPAYLFFTSGTTGVPKGVLGRHCGLVHFLNWQHERFGIGTGDRAAQLTGLTFDVVLRDILTPVTSGATVCLLDDERDLSAANIIPWLAQERITYLHSVPSLAQSWLGGGASKRVLENLRYVFFAGEPLTGELIRSWRETFGDHTDFINLYGPTETTLAKCYYVVPKSDTLPTVTPIGQPLPQTQVLILNAEQELCGIGELGEIVIRTPFRSLGYLQEDEKSMARFASNPFTKEPEDIVYFTGDLGAYRPDGLLEIAGRLDDQIKIRGMRVEIGEIQSALVNHPLVEVAVVTTYPSPNGEKRLAAYFVPANDTIDAAALRAHAKEKLPGFMVPAVFLKLDAIPLTPNGKVDRRRLPDPATAIPEMTGTAFIAPKTQLERTIGNIWSELLGVEQVGIHDNFFDLGGHSLLLLQVKTRLTETLKQDIPMVSLFQYPTVSSLAAHLNKGETETVNMAESQQRANMRQDNLRQRRQKRMMNDNKTRQ